MAKDYKISLLNDFYGDLLTDKQRDCVELYYDQDLSLGEIAENTGITRQGVRDSIKRGEATLLEMESKLGLAGKHQSMDENLTRIKEAAQKIRLLNDNYNTSVEIAQAVETILQTAEEIAQ